MERLIVGCGYLGYRVAQRWVAAGDTVFALTRSTQRGSWLKQQKLTPLVGDITQPASLPPLPSVDSVLIAVGFDRSSGKTIRQVYEDGLSNILDRLPATIRRIVDTSSTGVYEELARLTAAPRPVFSGIFASPAAAARAASSKRVRNRRLIEQLGIELRYPDYRLGLAAIVQAWKAVQASES